MINIDRLVTWLNQANIAGTNNPLYQTIYYLIRAIKELQNETSEAISGIPIPVTGLEDLDFLTHSDESAILPNSRQLIAGTNVSFDDTVVNQRTVNVTISPGSVDDFVVASDGNPAGPLPIDDGAGNFIYVGYTPP